jgi:acetyl esterase/lipase
VTQQAAAEFKDAKNFHAEMLIPGILEWSIDASYPKGELSAEELAYISPLHHPFRTTVPLWINAGTAEVLHDQAEEFTNEMNKTEGNQAKFHPTPAVMHDLIMGYSAQGLEREMEIAVADARNFLSRNA